MKRGGRLDKVVEIELRRVMNEAGGNIETARKLLGVSRSTIYRMLLRYGIVRVPKQAELLEAKTAKDLSAG